MADRDLRSLKALRRLRRVETDAARRDLGDALTRETALASRAEALALEMDDARRHAGDFDRGAFIAWFMRGQAEQIRLAEAIADAAACTAAVRTLLAQRRVAETTADDALVAAIAAAEAVAAHREQVMLEDISRALKRAWERGSLGDAGG